MKPSTARPSTSPRLGLTLLALLAGLAGCVDVGAGGANLPPVRDVAPPEPEVAPRSTESEAAKVYFARVETNLKSQGLLRTDESGTHGTFSARQLVDNFIRIALYDEYVTTPLGLVARQTPSRLRRWDQPIRMNVEFGASVPLDQRASDRATVAAYAARLARLSGLSIRQTATNPNYTVLILNEDERRNFGPRLMQLVPGIDGTSIRAISEMPQSTFCLVFAFSEGNRSTYSSAIAVIRGEHPDGLRLSCVHEELAQGLGLANDSPDARPSIFNDNEEFSLLTKQDELMLRILYDPRLKPGMTEGEARPIIETIVNELLGGAS